MLRLPSRSVMKANREVYRLLHEGLQVEPWEERTGHTGEATEVFLVRKMRKTPVL